jgi:hypothetical protein
MNDKDCNLNILKIIVKIINEGTCQHGITFFLALSNKSNEHEKH